MSRVSEFSDAFDETRDKILERIRTKIPYGIRLQSDIMGDLTVRIMWVGMDHATEKELYFSRAYTFDEMTSIKDPLIIADLFVEAWNNAMKERKNEQSNDSGI